MDLNLSAWIRRRRKNIGPYALYIINTTGEYEGRIKSLERDLAAEKKRGRNMHRRAQKAEGALLRVTVILESGERYFYRKSHQDKITPMYLPRFFVIEALRQWRRK